MNGRKPGRAVAVGECMVELARDGDGRYGQSFGGDTFNTAVYLARAGVPTAYATALGDDPYSAGIIALADCEGIATDLVLRRPGRMPGLYLIETGPAGERTFHYWRDRSPARELLEGEDWREIADAIATARVAYISGVTLSLYGPLGLERLAEALGRARAAGGLVVMDGNYRQRGWAGEAERARRVMERFWQLADIALPTFDDEAALWGDGDPQATALRLARLGVAEIAVKLGAEGALVSGAGLELQRVGVPAPVAPVDTTAAGDSFNAAYIAARLAGRGEVEAARAGHRLAAVVIAHRGAIAPREACLAALAHEA